MTKTMQADIALRNAGYTITYNYYKGKAYPHAAKEGEQRTKLHTAVNLVKLCAQLLPNITLN